MADDDVADGQTVDNPFFSRLWIRMSANEPEAILTLRPRVVKHLRIAGVEPGIGPPEEVRRLLTTRIAQWADVIKMSGIRIDER